MDAYFTPAECTCASCQAMCMESTCMPTPAEARALMRAGHALRLARYEPRGTDEHAFVAPAPRGLEGATLRTTNSGRCTFLSAGRCELHGSGLKPMEGRLALHDRPWPLVRKQVYVTWSGRRYASVRAMLDKEMAAPSTAGLSVAPDENGSALTAITSGA